MAAHGSPKAALGSPKAAEIFPKVVHKVRARGRHMAALRLYIRSEGDTWQPEGGTWQPEGGT